MPSILGTDELTHGKAVGLVPPERGVKTAATIKKTAAAAISPQRAILEYRSLPQISRRIV
jgi:hypothetical protein